MKFRDHILNGLKHTKIPTEALQNLGEDFDGFNNNPKPFRQELNNIQQREYLTQRLDNSLNSINITVNDDDKMVQINLDNLT